MRQYPIWNQVSACIYKSSKSFGAKNDSSTSIKVGTSSVNSFDFVNHRTTRKALECGGFEFRFFVDGRLIKRAIVSKNKEYKELAIEGQ